MSNETYKDTCLVIHDISNHSPDAFNYTLKRHIRKFSNPYIVVKDKKLRFNSSGCKVFGKTDIFKEGTIHGRCTLNNVLHVSVFLGYSRIIFVGIDLYNSRYFWLKKDETRYSVKEKRRTFKSKHAIFKPTILLLQEFQKTNKVETFVYNPKSLLTGIMPVWKK